MKIIVSKRFDELKQKEKYAMVSTYFEMLEQFKTKTEITIALGLTEYEFKKFRKVYIDPEEEALYEIHPDLLQLAKDNGVHVSTLKKRLGEGWGVYIASTYPDNKSIEKLLFTGGGLQSFGKAE